MIENIENHPYLRRFNTILSDPTNDLIPKCENAGVCIDDVITMYNGVKIQNQSYYDNFSDILLLNKGIHEPQEEYVFSKVLDNIHSKKPLMIELGSYWAFYSLSFLQKHNNGKTICIEADEDLLSKGKNNFDLNNKNGEFIHDFVSSSAFKVDDFCEKRKIKKIDILHSDIQGFELEMLDGAKKSFSKDIIDYLFVSTHTNDLHYNCLDFIKHHMNIIFEVDLNDTFCEDGIIVACSKRIKFEQIILTKKTQVENKK
jgi:hypothetical protein